MNSQTGAAAIAKNLNLSPKQKLELAVGTLSGLKSVESIIENKFDSASERLNQISKYLFSVGGKRIRPILTLLVAQALGQKTPSQQVLDVAAGIELIHMATLLHDDIIDKSPLRRHETSPWIKYGTGDTLLCGDFLLTRAFSLCARLDTYIINKTEIACIELTEGEIDEQPLSKKSFTIKESLEISRKKTASLFRLACQSAAHLSQNDEHISELFAQCGENLGIAFQVLDDILDVTSTEDLLGKKAGIDIVEQKPSVVNVLWLESGSELAFQLLKSNTTITEEQRLLGLQQVCTSDAVKKAKEIATNYANNATSLIEQIDSKIKLEPRAKEALLSLSKYILERME